VSECQHEWITTSRLRLVIDDESAMLASIIPMPPTLMQVEFCGVCGALRLDPAVAQGCAAYERQKAST